MERNNFELRKLTEMEKQLALNLAVALYSELTETIPCDFFSPVVGLLQIIVDKRAEAMRKGEFGKVPIAEWVERERGPFQALIATFLEQEFVTAKAGGSDDTGTQS